MDTRLSLLFRSLLAVALFVGFYALAFAMAALLALLPILEILLVDRIHIQLGLLSLVGAAVIVWSILPRFDRFEAPGPRLTAAEHPRLFTEIERIAKATGQAMPAEVYLVPDINAWVAQRGGLMGIGSRRVMGIGLPLMQALSVSELRAVLAHEFGHYHAGDTALGPWIWRTREAIGRTANNLGSTGAALLALVQIPFVLYGKLFLRVTLAVSRAQEYAADRLAAGIEGPRSLASGLRKVHGAAAAFEPFFREEFAPVLSAGFRPPLAAGFATFLQAPTIAARIHEFVEREIRTGKGDPYDSHPALGARIAALEALPAGAASATDDRPGTALLDEVLATEKALFAKVFPAAAGLDPVRWEDVPARVLVPRWQTWQERTTPALAPHTVGDVPTDTAGLAAVGRLLAAEGARDATERQLAEAGASGVEGAIGLALLAHGWTVVAPPGEPTRFEREAHVLRPWATFVEILDGKRPPSDWRELAEAAGVAQVPLARPPGAGEGGAPS